MHCWAIPVMKAYAETRAGSAQNKAQKPLGKHWEKCPTTWTTSNNYLMLEMWDCPDTNMEGAQELLTDTVAALLKKNTFPILLGGGHDIAYGHYNGIKKHLLSKNKRPSIGIINFDAHFDLRDDAKESNSGTPFYQIANENEPFHYLCLGIRKDANDRILFKRAEDYHVAFMDKNTFRIQFSKEITTWIRAFMDKVQYVYVTLDLDGFSSAYAPGVSAPSPMGFSPDIVTESLETIYQFR